MDYDQLKYRPISANLIIELEGYEGQPGADVRRMCHVAHACALSASGEPIWPSLDAAMSDDFRHVKRCAETALAKAGLLDPELIAGN